MARRSRSLVTDARGRSRCWWGASDDDYAAYHDAEWGFPVTDDVRLFEKICLEGFQSGLSWLTILRKRPNFRKAFAGFNPARVARFRPDKVEKLLQDRGIVRHRGKIESVINNARRAAELQQEVGSLRGSAPDSWQASARARLRAARSREGSSPCGVVRGARMGAVWFLLDAVRREALWTGPGGPPGA